MESIELKDLSNHFNNLQHGGTGPNIFPDWIFTIEQTVKEICNDPDCKRINFKYTQETGFVFEVSDKEAADCIIKAIQEHENSQLIIIRDASKFLIEELEKIKKDLK